MSNPKHKKLLQFLASSGALAPGDPERIRVAKREYRRAYMRDYLRGYRDRKVVVRCSFDGEELARLDAGARVHGTRRATFLKRSAFAYLNRRYLVPNAQSVAYLEQELSTAASDLRELARRSVDGILGRRSQLLGLVARVEELERLVRTALREPEDIVEHLRARQVNDPELTRRLREVLNYADKDARP